MSITLFGTLDSRTFTWAPDLGRYSDNTPWAKGMPPEDMVVTDVVIRQTSLDDFVTSLMYLEAFGEARPFALPDLWIPFFPGARQDRRNADGDVLDTKNFLADLVDTSVGQYYGELFVFDVHSAKARLPHRAHSISAANVIAGHTIAGGSINPTEGYYDTIIAPDHGAVHRADQVAALYHTPVMVAEKVRDTSDGRITSYKVDYENFALDKVLVVDDICDGGATFEILAESLPGNTEKHLYVTHGLFSRGTERLKHRYDHIVTTNSVYRETGTGIQVIDLFPGMDVK